MNSTESLKKSFIHFSPVAVPEILCSLFARRISTAATRSPPFTRPRRRSARSPLPDPPGRGKSRENQTLPSRASPAIINRSLAGYRLRVHGGKYSERFLYLLGKVANFEAFPLEGKVASEA